MNRLEKIEKDLEKAREKAAECQAPAELLAFLNNPKDTPAASGQTGPKSADGKEKEDEAHEEA